MTCCFFGEVHFVKSKSSVPRSRCCVVCGGISSSPVLFLFWLIKLEQSIPIPFFFYFTAVLIYFSLFSALKWLLFKFGKEEK